MAGLTGKTRFRNQTRGPLNTPATGAAERVIEEYDLGNGAYRRVAYVEQAVALGGAAFQNLTTQLPANSRVLWGSLNLDTAVTLTTAVKLGLGTAADPDQFARSSVTMTKNAKTDNAPLEAVAINAAAVTMRVSTVDTNGAAAGTGTGTVRARVVYEYVSSIANA